MSRHFSPTGSTFSSLYSFYHCTTSKSRTPLLWWQPSTHTPPPQTEETDSHFVHTGPQTSVDNLPVYLNHLFLRHDCERAISLLPESFIRHDSEHQCRSSKPNLLFDLPLPLTFPFLKKKYLSHFSCQLLPLWKKSYSSWLSTKTTKYWRTWYPVDGGLSEERTHLSCHSPDVKVAFLCGRNLLPVHC